MYRIVLYRHFQQQWQYAQLTGLVDNQFRLDIGICGKPAHEEQFIAADLSISPEKNIVLEAEKLRERGWFIPNAAKEELSVLSLHFRMPRWTGYPAGAPWFDAWASGYLEPIQLAIGTHHNGVFRGDERFSGNYLFHYTVFNADLAMEVIEKIAQAAPEKFILDITLGRREKQVYIPIDPNLPEYLQALFRVVEKSARTIAGELPTLFPGDGILKPELLPPGEPDRRMIGQDAKRIRIQLEETWKISTKYWNPLADQDQSEVVFVYAMPIEKQNAVLAYLRTQVKGKVYKLDCENGMFETDLDNLFHGSFEGVIFDEDMKWIVYSAHHSTLTFGGEALVTTLRHIYKDQPDVLNKW